MNSPDVILHLLDGSQRSPVQTWKFRAQGLIRVGRFDDNDVIVRQPMVSRAHATLQWNGCDWTLTNQSRFGTLVNGSTVSEQVLQAGDRFQLGPLGPVLSLESGLTRTPPSSLGTITLDTMDESLHHADETAEQVKQITGTDYFKTLQELARKIKASDPQSP